MNCNNYFDMTDQGDSFESWQGLRGPAGPQGTPGPPGSGVELRGPVASVADLPATAPSGELWMVGAVSPYEGYFYNGGSWEDLGQIAVGPVGPEGPTGATPDLQIGTVETGAPGSAAEASITGTPEEPRLNLTLPQGQQGPTGPQGETGATGVTFTPSVSISGVISWTNDGGLPNPASIDIRGPQGPQGRGVAVGGSAGQVLKKQSATNYDTAWAPDPNANVGIVQNGNTATQNISKGQYVIWQGALYTASAAIASGDTLSSSNLTAETGGGLNQFLARSQQGRIAASASVTIQLKTDSNGIAIFPSVNDGYKDIAIFRCTDQGSVSIKSMFNTTIGFTTQGNNLTITNPSPASVLPYFIMYW